MKIAVMSCIHGNYEALNAVLLDINQQKAEKIFCVGDLVGYGPHPNAVINQIRSLDIPTCAGCWDEDIVEGLNACDLFLAAGGLCPDKRNATSPNGRNARDLLHPS